MCRDEGPLHLRAVKNHRRGNLCQVIHFLDRTNPRRTNKPFFVCTTRRARMSPPCCRTNTWPWWARRAARIGAFNEAGMKQLDDNIGYVLKKLEDMGQLDNTIVVFTTDMVPSAITWPDGGVTPFRGQKGSAWEGGYRVPQVVRWPGHIQPGTLKTESSAALDWLPTLVASPAGPRQTTDSRSRSRPANIPASSRRRSTASTSANTSKGSRTSRRVHSTQLPIGKPRNAGI